MKTVNLNKIILSFKGESIKDSDNEDITFKDVMLSHLGLFMSKSGKDMIMAVEVGRKIYDKKDTIDLEEAEFEILKRSLESPKMTALAVGPVLKELEKV